MIEYFKSWLVRTWVGIKGLLHWSKTGYLWILLVLIVLGVEYLLEVSWAHIWTTAIVGMVLVVTEMINYAIERVCDTLGTGYNKNIKIAKDVCAGAVLAAGIVFFGVSAWIIFQ